MSATRGCQDRLRLPMRSTWSQALATTLAGSSSTPSRPSAGSSLTAKSRLDAELLGAIAVALFDAALGVEPVAAHVPFADGAGRTRHRIGTAHDADHEIAARKAAALRRFFDAAERLVPEDQTLARRAAARRNRRR